MQGGALTLYSVARPPLRCAPSHETGCPRLVAPLTSSEGLGAVGRAGPRGALISADVVLPRAFKRANSKGLLADLPQRWF